MSEDKMLNLEELENVAGGGYDGKYIKKEGIFCVKCKEFPEDGKAGQPCKVCGTILKDLVVIMPEK